MSNNRIVTIVILIFVFALNNFGQTKHISADEFNSATAAAREKLRSVTYRSIYVQKFYDSGKLMQTRTTINENILPDRSRISFTSESDGRVKPILEEIQIGELHYSRSDGGNWINQKLPPPQVSRVESNSGAAKPSIASEIKQLGQYLVVDSTYANKPVKLYYEFKCRLLGEIMYITEYRFWIDSHGLIVKQTDSQRNTTPDNITLQNATTYEYNPKDLKIEAPIK